MDKVRYGVVGYGNMGKDDAKRIRDEVKDCEVAAICDTNPERRAAAQKEFPNAKIFEKYGDMLAGDVIDAAYIATPHYFHPQMVEQALAAGKHALCEKPAGVYTRQVSDMYKKLPELTKNGKIFAMMFNQRPHPAHQKIKQLITSGELGDIRRINWIITDWYRTQTYFNSGGWRATWKGEGGGVLINQCPHQLDLWQWLFGLPQRVRAFIGFGKYHDIEVDDDVTAYMEYPNGATGVFITTTGDAPGTNRLEITADRGKLVFEAGKLTFFRNTEKVSEHLKTCPQGFTKPECWTCEIPTAQGGFGHTEIHQNFVNAILKGEKLIAQGTEGINGLTLGNSMLLSAWTDNWVNLPIDADLFYDKLQLAIKNSKSTKDPSKSVVSDLAGSSNV